MNVDFTDLDTDLSKTTSKPKTVEESIEKWGRENQSSQGAIYEENCDKCRGTGRWHSWSGVGGFCFKCNGTGKLHFRTSPETRAARKQRSQDKKIRAAQELHRAKVAWTDAHLDEWACIREGANSGSGSWSEFCASLVMALDKYGSLTENQLAAIRRSIERAKEARRAREESAPKVSAILRAFDSALSNGLKRPKLRLWDLELSLASATSKNAGHVYVKYAGEYVGKVAPNGKFYATRSCPPAALELISKLEGDVLEQAVAYGKETGICCCCGRELENELSVQLGIGPICRERWGL